MISLSLRVQLEESAERISDGFHRWAAHAGYVVHPSPTGGWTLSRGSRFSLHPLGTRHFWCLLPNAGGDLRHCMLTLQVWTLPLTGRLGGHAAPLLMREFLTGLVAFLPMTWNPPDVPEASPIPRLHLRHLPGHTVLFLLSYLGLWLALVLWFTLYGSTLILAHYTASPAGLSTHLLRTLGPIDVIMGGLQLGLLIGTTASWLLFPGLVLSECASRWGGWTGRYLLLLGLLLAGHVLVGVDQAIPRASLPWQIFAGLVGLGCAPLAGFWGYVVPWRWTRRDLGGRFAR